MSDRPRVRLCFGNATRWLEAALPCCLLAACMSMPRSDDAPQRLADAVRAQPIVLLGEVHDNAAQHALRARALSDLLAGGARPALLMEQFDRERQADIDRVLALPGATADAVIAAAAPAGNAGWDWSFYKPYIALALQYRVPLVAVNVSRDDARRAMRDGLTSLGFDASVPEDIASAQAADIEAGHCGAIDNSTARRMVAAQEARDQFMARQVDAHAARGVVLLAGNGHVRRDIGVPRWLDPATRRHSISIGLLEEGNSGATAYDIAVITPSQLRPDPCAAFRRDAQMR